MAVSVATVTGTRMTLKSGRGIARITLNSIGTAVKEFGFPGATIPLLALDGQQSFFRRHLFPQHFQIALYPRVRGIPVERLGKPTIRGG
jgi:hypothetical protein